MNETPVGARKTTESTNAELFYLPFQQERRCGVVRVDHANASNLLVMVLTQVAHVAAIPSIKAIRLQGARRRNPILRHQHFQAIQVPCFQGWPSRVANRGIFQFILGIDVRVGIYDEQK